MKIKDTEEAIASLHRYYHCSVEMKYQFAEIWHGPLPLIAAELYTEEQNHQSMYGYMYMSLWLGFLNSVIEGWQMIGLVDERIDALLSMGYLQNIQVFRHTVFHYQQNYWAKMAEKHLGVEGFVPWTQELDAEFDRWFIANGTETMAKQAQ